MPHLLRAMVVAGCFAAPSIVAQPTSGPGTPQRGQRVIDVHVHAGSIASLPKTLAELDSNGVVIALVNGPAAIATAWAASQPKRMMAGALLPCPSGRVPNNGPQCF